MELFRFFYEPSFSTLYKSAAIYKIYKIVFIFLFCLSPAWGQESETQESETQESETLGEFIEDEISSSSEEEDSFFLDEDLNKDIDDPFLTEEESLEDQESSMSLTEEGSLEDQESSMSLTEEESLEDQESSMSLTEEESLEDQESSTSLTEEGSLEDQESSMSLTEDSEQPYKDLPSSEDMIEIESLKTLKEKTHSKRVKFIKHPNAKKGLYRITADGNYLYKVNESKKKYGLSIKVGSLVLQHLKNEETGISFKKIYKKRVPSVYVEYYWSFFKNRKVPRILKKSRVKVGSGLLFAQGKGVFARSHFKNVSSREKYTFIAFPNHLGLHLGFEFRNQQIILPYVTVAIEYIIGLEFQNDNFKRIKFLGQLGAHVEGGIAISLGWLDRNLKFDLDKEFGINQTYFTIGLRQNIPIQTSFNFAATMLNAGLQLEF